MHGHTEIELHCSAPRIINYGRAEVAGGCEDDDNGRQKDQEGGSSGPLTTEAASEGQILGLDGNTLGVDSGEVCVLEERDEVCLRRLLQGHDGGRLEPEVRLKSRSA